MLHLLQCCSSSDSRGDRYLGHNSRHTQVPVPATSFGLDSFKGLLGDLSKNSLLVHTTFGKKRKKIWKQAKNTLKFAMSKVENGRNKLQNDNDKERIINNV